MDPNSSQSNQESTQESTDDKIYKMASLQLTISQLADFFEIDEEEFTNKYYKVFKKGQSHGLAQIRKWQFKLAEEGDKEIMRLLCRQFLDESRR